MRRMEQPCIMSSHNPENLVNITATNKIGNKTSSTIRLATLKARSVKNKDEMTVDMFIKARIDVGLLTETWLKDTPEDQAWVNQSDLTQSNYKLEQHNWQGDRRGGGIVLLYHKNAKATLVELGHMHTTEYALWKTILQNKPLYIMGIYHPPPGNDTTNAIFIYDITDLLVDKIGKYNNTVMLRDLNMHIDDPTNGNSHIFNDTMQACGVKQHVTSPTPQIWPHPRSSVQ